MSTLPRGIQSVQHSGSHYYRVRINRRDFKSDKYFKSLDEAKEFLALSKAKKGKELIYSITEEERRTKHTTGDYSLGYFIDRYIEDYLPDRGGSELQRRNRANKLSFFRTIKNASVLDRSLTHEEKEALYIDTQVDDRVYRFFRGFDVRKIKAIDINNYIRTRLHFVKPISVSRELSFISAVFRKLQYFDESLADVVNPVPLHDRDLLKSTAVKRETILTEEDEQRLFEVLAGKRNKQLYNIAKASLLTGMRRSEVITLTPEQVKDTYVQLIHTKSGRPRKVYLTQEAREFFAQLKPATPGKYFTYTIVGFDRVIREVLQKAGLGHLRFHDLRRTNISRLLTKIGHDNTILATEILGLQSIKKFEELHAEQLPQEPKTQAQAIKNWHSSAQMTKGYYNIVFKNVPGTK